MWRLVASCCPPNNIITRERETVREGSLCGSHVVLAVVSKEKDGRKEGNG
jgi:hypothetical protein